MDSVNTVMYLIHKLKGDCCEKGSGLRQLLVTRILETKANALRIRSTEVIHFDNLLIEITDDNQNISTDWYDARGEKLYGNNAEKNKHAGA